MIQYGSFKTNFSYRIVCLADPPISDIVTVLDTDCSDWTIERVCLKKSDPLWYKFAVYAVHCAHITLHYNFFKVT